MQLAIKYCQNILAPIHILPMQSFTEEKCTHFIIQNSWNISNKRPMSQFAKLWLYHNIDKERKKNIISYFRIECFFIVKNWITSTHGWFAPSLLEIGRMVLEKKIFNFWQCIFPTLLLSSLGKGWGPSFEQIWISFN